MTRHPHIPHEIAKDPQQPSAQAVRPIKNLPAKSTAGELGEVQVKGATKEKPMIRPKAGPAPAGQIPAQKETQPGHEQDHRANIGKIRPSRLNSHPGQDLLLGQSRVLKPVRVKNVSAKTEQTHTKTSQAKRVQASPKTVDHKPSAEQVPSWIKAEQKAESKAKVPSNSQWAQTWQAFRAMVNLKKLLLILALVALLIIFALAPAFRFQKLAGTDLFLHTREELLEASDLRMGQHFLHSYGGSMRAILTGRYERAEQNILKAFPELRSLSVSFKFPSTLYIEAEERIPLAFLDVNDTYVTVDRFGVVTGSYQQLPQGLPAIRGIEPVQMRVGETIKTNADESLKACVAVMAALVEADFESPGGTLLLPQAREIRSSGYQRILLTFQPDGSSDPLRVTCSSTSTLKEDFLWLKKVLDSKVLQDKLPGNLDIYGSQLVFRPYTVNDQGEEENTGDNYVWQDDIFVPEEDYGAADDQVAEDDNYVENDLPAENYLPEEGDIPLQDDVP